MRFKELLSHSETIFKVLWICLFPSKAPWEKYDPSWLVELADEYKDEYPWLRGAFKECSFVRRESCYYHRFVDTSSKNWNFDMNVIMEDPAQGDIIVDVLKDQKIGGIEFSNRLLDNF